MTLQLTLPLPQETIALPQRLVLKWLRTANAGNFHGDEKRDSFYPIKNRILKEHGRFIGWDTQRITRQCWSCDGTGRWHYWYHHGGEWRYKCRGTGVYRYDYILLGRWMLWGAIFHKPADLDWLNYQGTFQLGLFHHHYKGLLKHGEVKTTDARRALFILRLLYSPRDLAVQKFRDWKMRCIQRWICLRYQFDYFFESLGTSYRDMWESGFDPYDQLPF